MRLSARRSVLLSFGVHGALAAVLAVTLAGAGGKRPVPGRVNAALVIPVDIEPEAPPPPEAEPPVVPEPGEEALPVIDEGPAEEVRDARFESTPAGGAAGSGDFGGRGEEIGLGGARPMGTGRGRRRAAAEAAVIPQAEAAPPAPVEPTSRARPVRGSCAAPAYPPREHRLGVEGAVLLSVAVDSTGAVQEVVVETSSDSPALDRAAAAAVRGWRFEPALLDGVPVPDRVLVPVRFVLRSAALAREE